MFLSSFPVKRFGLTGILSNEFLLRIYLRTKIYFICRGSLIFTSSNFLPFYSINLFYKQCFFWKNKVIQALVVKSKFFRHRNRKMNASYKTEKRFFRRQNGFSLPELVIVLLVAAIILVLALPQIISSSRLFRFSGLQRQIASSLRDARQEAMSQRKPVTFRYQHNKRQIIIYGGSFGAFGDGKNTVYEMTGSGLEKNDLRYGRPGGVSSAALGDGTNLTALSSNMVEITFQPDGSVVDASNNPQNKALFFYHNKHRQETAFAISVLGAGGRAKFWRYSKGVNTYVE